MPDRPPPAETAGPKPASYFGNPREDMVALLPRPLGRVLDVGCGAGATAPAFRAAGAAELVGIELVPAEAEKARATYDRVVAGDALAAVRSSEAGSEFDTIACYDVLEHLADPLALVAALHDLAAPDARLHVSVPNARHLSLARDLYLRGTFGYTATGHRDSTHLRWFTRRDIETLVDTAGWTVRSATPSLPGRSAAADRLTLGAAREFVALQWRILAVR